MCTASVSSSGSSKIIKMKQLAQDGRMTANNICTGPCSVDSFHCPEKMNEAVEGLLMQTPQKSDSIEPHETGDDFQKNQDFIGALPTEDIHRNGLPTYSVFLCKSASDVSNENCPADMNPLIITANSGAMPCLTEIFSIMSQSARLFHGSGHVSTEAVHSPFTSLSSVQGLNPIWLQVLSNILSGSSDVNKMSESLSWNPVKPEKQPVLVSPESKSVSTLASGTEEAIKEGTLAKTPLSDITNKLNRLQNVDNSMTTEFSAGELIVMSPTTTSHGSHSRTSSTAVYVVPQSSYLPAFIDKMCLSSSMEDSQMASPLRTDHAKEQSLNHELGAVTMSKLSLPPLISCPVGSSHKRYGGLLRESHNMKERRRRARIKNACNLMRQLVPGMSNKTDKATVFEFSARYIHFLKSFVGSSCDKEFLLKYNPY